MLKRVLLLLSIVLALGSQLLAQGGAARRKENLDLPFDALGLSSAALMFIFYGQNFEGDGIFYCLDRSASTRNGELAREKQEVVQNIQDFSRDVQFGIVFYDRSVRMFPEDGRPAEATKADKARAIGWVLAQQAGGGTCAGKGVAETLRMANFSTARRNVLISIGDGCTTCPGFDQRQYAKQSLAEIAEMNFRRYPIHSIKVGNDDAGRCDYWAKPLAEMNGGTYTVIAK